ncbi:MAG TPA: hypothetical protein VHZ04_01925 [Candidatus Paceibacterota bacterium]|jgi:Tfp pilus assembly protein PilV|nr:hypothetical protein [Candidatus Paceibacterota bacterium]
MMIMRIKPTRGRKKASGQSIIEAMIAMGILTIGFLGIAALLVRSFQISRTTSDDVTATYLASEGIEVMKNILDHDVYAIPPAGASLGWGTCTDTSGTTHCTESGAYKADYESAVPQEIGGPGAVCFSGAAPSADFILNFDAASGAYGYAAGGTPSKFARCIQFTHNGEEITVNSIVDWTTNGIAESLNLEDHFYNWNPGS